MDQPEPSLGAAIRRRREAAGLSQRALAARAGVSERSVRNLESGAVLRPQRAAVLRLAEAVGLDATVLPATDGVRVGVLGPLVVEAGGVAADVGPAKQRALLGLLAVQPGVLLGVGELVDALWEERPPASAVNLVHTYSSRLRRALESCGPEVRVVSGRGGYLLQAEADALDVLRFDEHLAAAAEAGASPEAAGHVERALDCWRGPLLGDLPASVRLHPAAAAVQRRRLNAALTYADAALAAGSCDPERLQPLVDGDPMHEGLHARLMLALAAAGEQATALRAFDDIRRRLDDELGVGPGQELRAAHLRVLRNEVGPAPNVGASTPAQLPAEVAGFVGRDEDLGRLDAVADQARAMPILSIVGAPGVGKTALAVRWAHRVSGRYPDGQLYVNLRGYDERSPMQPIEALARFLRALGVAPGQVPADEDEAAALYRTLLADRKVLVVLDNASSAEQVQPLLPGSESSAVVVTSRDSLAGLTAAHGARRVNLDVLRPDEAQRLVAGIIGDNRAAADPDGLAALARTCGYLPLALRVVAADLDEQSYTAVGAYADDLSGAAEIAGGDAVRAAFDLSYERLDSTAQQAFRLLGLMPGLDASAADLAALADSSVAEARRLAARLVAANLLQTHPGGRYRFHDLLRDYAATRAAADLDAQRIAALERLFDYYLHTVDAATRLLYPYEHQTMRPLQVTSRPPEEFSTTDRALTWLDNERWNLREAIMHAAELGRPDYAWRLARSLRGYLWARGSGVDVMPAAETALRVAQQHGKPADEAAMQDVLGIVLYNLSQYERAIECHAAARNLYRGFGDRPAEALALHHLGRSMSQLGEPTEQLKCHEESVAISREIGDTAGEARDLNYVGVAWLQLGRLDKGEACCEEALRVSREIGDKIVEARAAHAVGVVYWARGRLTDSIDQFQATLGLRRTLGLDHAEAATANCVAESYLDLGRDVEAAEYARLAFERGRQVGERRQEAGGLEMLARVCARRGEYDDAARLFDRSIELARQIGFSYGQVSVLHCRTELERNVGQPDHALRWADEAWRLLTESGIRLLRADVLVDQAWALLELGRPDQARVRASDALVSARSTGRRLVEARALHVLGSVKIASGEDSGARMAWHEALRLFTEMGTRDAVIVTDLLAAMDQR